MKIGLDEYIEKGVSARKAIDIEKIRFIANEMLSRFKRGGKLITFGNGGSAADAQHFVGELDGHFTIERGALPAIALSTNTSSLTAIGNDYTYADVFSRPVSSLATSNDVIVGISTSGNSQNVVNAMLEAKKKGALTVAMTGKAGGKLAGIADMLLNADSDFTPVIQETHITMIHMICLEIDNLMEKH